MTGMRLDSLVIEHGGPGAVLTVVEAGGVSVASMAPNTWPQLGTTLTGHVLPFYFEGMDTGRRCGGVLLVLELMTAGEGRLRTAATVAICIASACCFTFSTSPCCLPWLCCSAAC